MKKLTKPQRELLETIVSLGATHVAETYAPAQSLVERGYAEWHTIKYSPMLYPTDAGRAALKDVE